MESEENDASSVSSCETNSTESYDARQRSGESTAAPSVETQPTVSHRSQSSLETDARSRRTSFQLQSEAEERVYSHGQKSPISSALNFSRHFTNRGTDSVEEEDVSYDDTFDSLDSLSESEDASEKTPRGIQFHSGDAQSNSNGSRSDSRGSGSISSGHRSSSTGKSSRKRKTSVDSRSKSSSSGTEDTLYSEVEDAHRRESISSQEGGIRSLSPAAVNENDLPSLGLSQDSSVWSPSDQNTTDHSFEDKFTSADGEIIYYSDFSIEALTARQYTQRSDILQYTQRSDILEWSQNLKNVNIIPESDEFIQKKIQLLKQRPPLSDEQREAPSLSSVRSRRADLERSVDDSVDLKNFCSRKLHRLKNIDIGTDSGSHSKKSSSSEATDFYRRLKDDSDVVVRGIPFTVVQRLQMDMKSKIDFHEPIACDRCRQKLGELGLSEFLQSKMAIVREQLTNLKLTDARNASTYGMKIFGEILAEASCLNCNPELIMQRLLEPLAVHASSTETVTKSALYETEPFGVWTQEQQL